MFGPTVCCSTPYEYHLVLGPEWLKSAVMVVRWMLAYRKLWWGGGALLLDKVLIDWLQWQESVA